MRTGKNLAVVFSLLSLVVFAVGGAAAERPVASLGEANELLVRTPELRAQQW
jgi:hypothetical protein